MPPGIKIKDEKIGTGDIAEHGKVAVVHFRSRLNKGEERANTYSSGHPARIHLGKREVIPGLERGIEGMRVGGKRELVVSPHLAYGEKGVPGSIPPNAVLRFEVELLELREPGDLRPEDFPPGKQLTIRGYNDVTTQNLCAWQFSVIEDGRGSVLFHYPQPEGNRRHAHAGYIQIDWSQAEAAEFIQEVLAMPERFPDECLSSDECWVDHSEQAHAITKDKRANTSCINIYGAERGTVLCSYYLRENSPALTSSKWFARMSEVLVSQVPAALRISEEQKNRSKGNFSWADD